MDPTIITQIQGVEYDKLLNDLARLTTPPREDLSSVKVDRKFLELNFGWTRIIVERYETSGRLQRIEIPRDKKSAYYSLKEVLSLRRFEIESLHSPKR